MGMKGGVALYRVHDVEMADVLSDLEVGRSGWDTGKIIDLWGVTVYAVAYGDNIDPLCYCPVDVTRYSERDKATTDFVAEFLHAECSSQTTFSEYTRERFCEAVRASKKAHPAIWGTRLKTMRDFADRRPCIPGDLDMKQVIVIRRDLNMRKGKLAAQAAHASMKVLLDRGGIANNDLTNEAFMLIKLTHELNAWLSGAFTKVVVGVDTEAEFMALQEAATAAGILNAAIQDNGYTEFHGVPTWTALAIGPDTPEKINLITGHLKLL